MQILCRCQREFRFKSTLGSSFKGKCGVKLVAAKVIRQRAFFSALSYFLYNNHLKNIIVLIDTNCDKMNNCKSNPNLMDWFNHENLVISFYTNKLIKKK